MNNGCSDHLYEAVPGCALCYAHLQGGNDALRSELAAARRTGEYWKAEHNAANFQLSAVCEALVVRRAIGEGLGID